MSVSQCFICREWSWSVCPSMNGADLCLPCYVDVLEIRQNRGGAAALYLGSLPHKGPDEPPGGKATPPDPAKQLELF